MIDGDTDDKLVEAAMIGVDDGDDVVDGDRADGLVSATLSGLTIMTM